MYSHFVPNQDIPVAPFEQGLCPGTHAKLCSGFVNKQAIPQGCLSGITDVLIEERLSSPRAQFENYYFTEFQFLWKFYSTH